MDVLEWSGCCNVDGCLLSGEEWMILSILTFLFILFFRSYFVTVNFDTLFFSFLILLLLFNNNIPNRPGSHFFSETGF